MSMKKSFALLVAVVGTGVCLAQPAHAQRFNLVEASVQDMQAALRSGVVTSEQLTRMYLARIAAYDDAGPRLNAYLSVNPDAIRQAQLRDQQPVPNSPLSGIPVLLKDNIDTADQPTTAGSVALRGSVPPDDAFITMRLRRAGAIILGKATLSEFANFIANRQPTGYSSLGGFGRNPYDPVLNANGEPRLMTGGSSSGSGIGVSANLAAVAIGTETSGSILSPSSANGIVGIKPTVGLVSRDGIIPISMEQDTAGPMARTVTDAAILLGVIAGFDPADPATAACRTPGRCFSDYTQFLDEDALVGARIAVPPIQGNAAIRNPAIAALRREGETVVNVGAYAQTSSSVLQYAFKRDLNAYLAATPAAPRRTLAQIIAFNRTVNPPLRYGQALAIASNALDITPGSADSARFTRERADDLRVSRGTLNNVFAGPDGRLGTADDFDAVLHFANTYANVPAKAGYPRVLVPGGFTGARPAPSGVTFSGPAFSEPRLIALAYAYEQATLNRRPPPSAPALPTDIIR